MIIAASHAGKPLIAEKLKQLRGAWQGYNKFEVERGAKEAALMKEVERVDRTAARISQETERLKRLRDEAMEIVRRVEPGLVDSPVMNRPLSSRSFTQDDDMLYLNKDLKQVRDLILSENFHDDAGPKLTEMYRSKNVSGLRRHGSYGSLLPSSPGHTVPPPMPLINNWGGQNGRYSPCYPPPPHYAYEDQFGYYPYPPLYPDPYHDQHFRKYSHPHMKRMHQRHHHKYDRDMSSEGENTSNDACDLSSSEASGSGRRRKNKSMSPKPPLIPRHTKSVQQSRKSPRDKLKTESSKPKPLKTSTPTKKDNEDLNIDLNNSADLSEAGNNSEICDDVQSQIDAIIEQTQPPHIEDAIESNEESEGHEHIQNLEETKRKTELQRVESEQNFMIESGEENNKLYSSEETETSERMPPAAKKSSVDRERKVGLGLTPPAPVTHPVNPSETDAYQQMLMGAAKKAPAPIIDDETSSDDIEAQLAFAPQRPKTNFMSGTMHNNDDESLDNSPDQVPKKQQRPVDTAPAAEPLRISGMGGHSMPLAFGMSGGSQPGLLAGGKLGHPLAQRVGMMALSSNNKTEDTGHLSAPDNDDDDDFWS